MESQEPRTRLIQLRQDLGLTQRQLAREFRVSSGAVGFWESGSRQVPGPVLKLIEVYERRLRPSSIDESVDEATVERISRAWADALARMDGSARESLTEYLARYLREGLSRDPITQNVQLAVYGRLIRQIVESKGLLLKIVQLGSHLDPDVPPELRECLGLLQGATTAMPASQAARVVEEDLGAPPSRLFSEWSPKPFAAASIGQVHLARLRSGERVAVKVQYHDIRERLERAFGNAMIRELLATLLRTSSEMLDEFQARVLEECDYRREARNQALFHERFRDEPGIRVPRVHDELSTGRVLVSEYMDGATFKEFLASATQDEKNRAAEAIVRFQGISFFRHRSMYVDMHPGNLLFLPEQVVFLDFGRIIPLDARDTELLRALTAAVLGDDQAVGRRVVTELGIVRDWTDFDFAGLWQLFRQQHRHFLEVEPFKFDWTYLARKKELMRSYAQKHLLKLNAPVFWNYFAISTHDALRAELGARSDWRRVMDQVTKARLPARG